MTPSFMERKRAELRARGIDPDRLPPGQYVTERFPVLHLGPVPDHAVLDDWTLTIGGDGVERPRVLSWDELRALPDAEMTTDIHCVTKWSRLDVTWEGVMLADLLAQSGPVGNASTLVAVADHHFSASISWPELRSHDAMVAWAVDGAPLSPEHGHPLRLVVPHLYFWKSVKWLRRIELWCDQRDGYWEHHGYHRHGDPFAEERYWGDGAVVPDGRPAHVEASLSRPLHSLLRGALATPSGTVVGDVERLRDAVAVVLRRRLDLPGADWPTLIAASSARGGWEVWRRDGLSQAADAGSDPAPEATRDLLAELAEELTVRGDVLPGGWEGEHRQAATASDEWLAGRRRRELVFTLERLVGLAQERDVEGLRALAASIARQDVTMELPRVPESVRSIADELEEQGAPGETGIGALASSLTGTPFEAAARALGAASWRTVSGDPPPSERGAPR